MSLLPSMLFYILAIVVIVSAAYTAFSSRLVHAAFSLLFTFFGLACLYVLLGADFVGLSQVIIYVGGILALLLFGVMLTGRESAEAPKQTMQLKWGAAFLAVLAAALIPLAMTAPWQIMENPESKTLASTISPVGELLLTKYLLPFEAASLLLLIALIGAVVIARGEPKKVMNDE
ncbi:MAG: NADH-quinone oxidoreductase subunit J [Candidatus Omnitrophota bacterium]